MRLSLAIRQIRESFAKWLAPWLTWNSDMSREVDGLIIERDHHREIIQRLLDENAKLRTQQKETRDGKPDL
jgi:hypothetical protein